MRNGAPPTGPARPPRPVLSITGAIPPSIRRGWIEFVVRPKPWQSCALVPAVAMAVYVVEAIVARAAIFQDECAVLWPINGIVLGMLLVVRRRHWPAVLLGFGAGLAASEWSEPHRGVMIDALCNGLEVALPALALPRFRSMDKWLAQPGVTGRFVVLAMVAAPVVESLLAPLYFTPRAGNSYLYTAVRWGAADAIGIALFTPLVLALLTRETWMLFRRTAFLKTVALVGLLTGGSWVLFHQNELRIAFVLYPLILMVATQLGLSGAILAINLVAIIVSEATVHGLGPFGVRNGDLPVLRVLELQVFLTLSVPMVLPVAVARVRRLTTEAKLKRALEAMEALATVDGLTGVANRRRFDMVLEREWRSALRSRLPVSLLLIDADKFKAYNDNYGHLAGDACLRLIAKAISEVPGRPGDVVARYGGEEFAVLLPGADDAGAGLVAERVCSAVFKLAQTHEFNEAKRVTVSVGIASIVPEEDTEPLLLIAVADKALYNAKHGGRNRVCRAVEAVGIEV